MLHSIWQKTDFTYCLQVECEWRKLELSERIQEGDACGSEYNGSCPIIHARLSWWLMRSWRQAVYFTTTENDEEEGKEWDSVSGCDGLRWKYRGPNALLLLERRRGAADENKQENRLCLHTVKVVVYGSTPKDSTPPLLTTSLAYVPHIHTSTFSKWQWPNIKKSWVRVPDEAGIIWWQKNIWLWDSHFLRRRGH